MFKRLKAALKLYDYISQVHSYITVLERSGQYGAIMFEKQIVEGNIVEVMYQGGWCKTLNGAVLSVVNTRNHKIKELKE